MMTDIELLKLAAKAASIAFDDDSEVFIGDCRYDWNPLTDDGDALRLAVKLNILIYQTELADKVNATYSSTPMNDVFTTPHEGDQYAATRRAIVLAAAEIGKAMK